MTVATFDGVTYAYGERPVLSDVDLVVEDGDLLGLLGPNGSGKSTFVELLLGLREPDRGTVTLFGERAATGDHGGRVGYVQQGAADGATLAPVTVRELVAAGRDVATGFGGRDDEDRARVDRALDRLGIADLADARVDRLSGGQRQRAFVARAVAADADLLVLDEPAVGVDAAARERFYDLLGELNADGTTIVLVEHDVGVVTRHATRVACLNGELYFHGPPDAFCECDAFERAYGSDQRLLAHDH